MPPICSEVFKPFISALDGAETYREYGSLQPFFQWSFIVFVLPLLL
jgi:hypothetical protein